MQIRTPNNILEKCQLHYDANQDANHPGTNLRNNSKLGIIFRYLSN
jgi:hypothetical protein